MSDKSHSDKSSSGDDIDVDDDADRQLVGGENVSPTCTVITEFMPPPAQSGEVLTSWVQERVLRGHKAAVHNPKVSKQAKEHSRQVGIAIVRVTSHVWKPASAGADPCLPSGSRGE